jgi:hypothetical protein
MSVRSLRVVILVSLFCRFVSAAPLNRVLALESLGFSAPPTQEILEHRVSERLGKILIEFALKSTGMIELKKTLAAFETLSKRSLQTPTTPDWLEPGEVSEQSHVIHEHGLGMLNEVLAANLLMYSPADPRYLAYAKEWIELFEQREKQVLAAKAKEQKRASFSRFLEAVFEARQHAVRWDPNLEHGPGLALAKLIQDRDLTPKGVEWDAEQLAEWEAESQSNPHTAASQQFASSIRSLLQSGSLSAGLSSTDLMDSVRELRWAWRLLKKEDPLVFAGVEEPLATLDKEWSLKAMSAATDRRGLAVAAAYAFPAAQLAYRQGNPGVLEEWLHHLKESPAFQNYYSGNVVDFIRERLDPESPYSALQGPNYDHGKIEVGEDDLSGLSTLTMFEKFPGLTPGNRFHLLRALLRHIVRDSDGSSFYRGQVRKAVAKAALVSASTQVLGGAKEWWNCVVMLGSAASPSDNEMAP